MLVRGDVSAIMSKIKGGIGFRVFPITICEFTNEMRFISAFRPSLAEVHTDGTRRAANLARESISLFSWEMLGQFEDLHREEAGLFVNLEFFG